MFSFLWVLASAISFDCSLKSVPKVSPEQPLRIAPIQDMAIRTASPKTCFGSGLGNHARLAARREGPAHRLPPSPLISPEPIRPWGFLLSATTRRLNTTKHSRPSIDCGMLPDDRVSPDTSASSRHTCPSQPDIDIELTTQIYKQLQGQAQRYMNAERAGHTLSATALVHEAFLKIAGPRDVPWQNRGHFYAAAAEAMRRVLLDHAKAKGRLRRGGGGRTVPLPESGPLDSAATMLEPGQSAEEMTDFVALDAAMCRLEERDPRMAQVVRLKFYAGLEIAQVALVLDVSERTVKNDWAFAKAWLERALRDTTNEPGPTER